MNKLYDWYLKQLADYNMWVRIPTWLVACVATPFIFVGNIFAIIAFLFVGVSFAAARNYYREY